jgi:hypothetical protein
LGSPSPHRQRILWTGYPDSQAFDEAWAYIEGNFGCDQAREAARVKLATVLLSVASDDSRDVEVLKRAALEVMAGDYRWRAMQSPTKQ